MRLDQVEARLGSKVSVQWKSFLLRPRPGHRTRDEFVAYTRSWERPAAMETSIEFRRWASDDEPPSHSLPALVAGKVVDGYGDDVSRRFHRNLMRAYFTDNRTISRVEVQAEVAADSGLDRQEFLDRLAVERDDATEAVLADHREAHEHGITAVPTVVLAELVAIPGAQDVDTYVHYVERILARRAS